MRGKKKMTEKGWDFGCTDEACWEYFGCIEKDCPLHGKTKDTKCWENPDTRCSMAYKVIEKYGNDKCDLCIYKKTRISSDRGLH